MNNYNSMVSGYFVSELRVLRSNAGYYAGRVCIDPAIPEAGLSIPFDRVSPYYATEAAAQTDVTLQAEGYCETEAERVAYNAYHDAQTIHGDRVAIALSLYSHKEQLDDADHVYVDQGLVAFFS